MDFMGQLCVEEVGRRRVSLAPGGGATWDVSASEASETAVKVAILLRGRQDGVAAAPRCRRPVAPARGSRHRRAALAWLGW
jgi:hypothetical protein